MKVNHREVQKLLLSEVPLCKEDDVYVIKTATKNLSEITFRFAPNKIILPLREGELIEDVEKLPLNEEYSLTYPGTASSKCVVLFQDDLNIFLGGMPSYEFARIAMKRVGQNDFHLTFVSKQHHYYIIPFENAWRKAADRYQKILGIPKKRTNKHKPMFLLQLGVSTPEKKVHIANFEELLPVVDLFHEHFGDGHIIHLFGTNKDGFDRMFPDYTIDPRLGGEKSLIRLLEHIKSLNCYSSQHYNPRIADIDWIKRHPSYRSAIVHDEGAEVKEPYAGQYHYVMNPNDEKWFARCLETVDYLANLGFDYLEIDQFVYQRNFYHPDKPLALSYQRLVNEFLKRGLKFWVEGLSDVFRFPEDNFCQILIRDRSQLWDDGENRRGYPYGQTYADFFMYLWPDTEVSYQVFTEHKLFDKIEERIAKARHINSAVYDLELGFYDENYVPNLKKIIQILEQNGIFQ